MRTLASIAAIAFGLAAAVGQSHAQDTEEHPLAFQIANETLAYITAVHMKPVGNPRWTNGAQIIIAPEEGAAIEPDGTDGSCLFDIRVTFLSGTTRTIRSVDACSTAALTISADAVWTTNVSGQGSYFEITA